MTFKLEPYIDKIISPVILVFPEGQTEYPNGQTEQSDGKSEYPNRQIEFPNGTAASEAKFNEKYAVKSIQAVGDKIEVSLEIVSTGPSDLGEKNDSTPRHKTSIFDGY